MDYYLNNATCQLSVFVLVMDTGSENEDQLSGTINELLLC